VAGRFGRVEPRRQAGANLTGLLATVERKNGWQLAEATGLRPPPRPPPTRPGDATPDKMQRLLNVARWDPEVFRMTCAPMSWSSWLVRVVC
jgi:hypothetical protein